MHFRYARAGQMFYFSLNFEGMLEHGFRVRVARRKGKSKALSFWFSCGLYLLLSHSPLHPTNRDALYMPGREPGGPQIMHARAERKRSWIAILMGKTEDKLACLRGTVSGGAEKENGS